MNGEPPLNPTLKGNLRNTLITENICESDSKAVLKAETFVQFTLQKSTVQLIVTDMQGELITPYVIPKQIFCSELVAGKRRQGGQIKCYKDNLKRSLRLCNISPSLLDSDRR